MVVIIDTGFLLALRNSKDEFHDQATKVMKDMLKNLFGTIIVSDYVFDETMTLAMVRTNKLDLVQDIEDYLFKSKRIKFHFINEKEFSNSRGLFNKYFDHKLSFTDCTVLNLFNSFPPPSYVATFEEPLNKLVSLVPGLSLS